MKTYKVKNRSSNRVMYSVPDLGVFRDFVPGEVKQISHEELEKLSYRPGGVTLISSYLQIDDLEAASEFNAGRPVELEYNFDENDVADLLRNGSLDSLLDALDFAPAGVVELIKTLAVSLPLADNNKLSAIKAKTGFDAAAAIRHLEEERQAALEEKKDTSNVYNNGGARRVQQDTASSGRRVQSTESKYKIVSAN